MENLQGEQDECNRYLIFVQLFKHCAVPPTFSLRRPGKNARNQETYFGFCGNKVAVEVFKAGGKNWQADKQKYLQFFSLSKW